MIARLALALAVVASAAAAAETRLVTHPQMCGLSEIDGQELGMALTARDMFEIEYLCEFAEPLELDWSQDRMLSRIGYCSAPGEIFPEQWAIGLFASEPGVAYVWWQSGDASDPTVFRACP